MCEIDQMRIDACRTIKIGWIRYCNWIYFDYFSRFPLCDLLAMRQFSKALSGSTIRILQIGESNLRLHASV